jgi:predicted metal-dependent phosphoesterase TrpH
MGIGISIEEVQAAAGPTVKSLGRPHLARALHTAKHTRYYAEAFAKFIGTSGPAYVAEGFPSPESAIEIIHAAGGRAIWAHPRIEEFDRLFPVLRAAGLDGVECFRPGVEWEASLHMENAVQQVDLLTSGGSDWHGPNRGRMGEFAIEGKRVRGLLKAGGIQVE